MVKAVLEAVDVPLIVTGHNHFDTVNEVMKAVAQACAARTCCSTGSSRTTTARSPARRWPTAIRWSPRAPST